MNVQSKQNTLHYKLDKNLFFNVNKNSGRWYFSDTPKEICLNKSISELGEWDESIKTIIVNITDKCNLNCIYCSRQFARKKASSMSAELVKEILKKVADYAQKKSIRVTVQFHGGEPLLEFDKIISVVDSIQNDKLKNLKLRIQTNGTLLNEKIIKECVKRKIQVGISLDGLQIENDSTRKNSCGGGTFKDVIKALKIIKRYQNEVSCLTVVTNINLNNLPKILDFFNDVGINDIGFLPLYEEPRTRTIKREMVPDMKSLANNQKKLFDEWLNLLKKKKYKNLNISTFQILIWNLLSSNGINKKFRVNCGLGVNSLFVESDGSVWGCGAFSYADELKLGDLNHDTLEDIQNKSNYKKFQERITSNTEKCKDCALQFICKGGCVANGYRQKGNIFNTDVWCDYWKGIIEYILIKVYENPKFINLVPNYNIKINKMIDHHVHLGYDEKTTFSLSQKDLSERLNRHKLDGAIVFSCPNVQIKERNPYQEGNKSVLIASKEDKRLIPFMFVHPFLDVMDYIESNQNYFRGFKVYPKASRMEYDYHKLNGVTTEFLIHTQKPIIFHIDAREGHKISDLTSFIKKKKRGQVVFAHSGDLIEEDLLFASEYPFIFIDISPLATMLYNRFFTDAHKRPKQLKTLNVYSILEYLAGKFGKQRVLWGSDAPWCDNLLERGYEGEVSISKKMQEFGLTSKLF